MEQNHNLVFPMRFHQSWGISIIDYDLDCMEARGLSEAFPDGSNTDHKAPEEETCKDEDEISLGKN